MEEKTKNINPSLVDNLKEYKRCFSITYSNVKYLGTLREKEARQFSELGIELWHILIMDDANTFRIDPFTFDEVDKALRLMLGSQVVDYLLAWK